MPKSVNHQLRNIIWNVSTTCLIDPFILDVEQTFKFLLLLSQFCAISSLQGFGECCQTNGKSFDISWIEENCKFLKVYVKLKIDGTSPSQQKKISSFWKKLSGPAVNVTLVKFRKILKYFKLHITFFVHFSFCPRLLPTMYKRLLRVKWKREPKVWTRLSVYIVRNEVRVSCI